jgi:hypothetical protein
LQIFYFFYNIVFSSPWGLIPKSPLSGSRGRLAAGRFISERIDLFNNPVGYFTSLARNPAGFNAPHFAVFKRLLFKN